MQIPSKQDHRTASQDLFRPFPGAWSQSTLVHVVTSSDKESNASPEATPLLSLHRKTLSSSPQICALRSILQNRFPSFCTTCIQKEIHQIQQTVPALPSQQAFETHFFLPAHSVKTGVHIADAQLAWKVLTDYWHLPRKGLMCVRAQSCPTLCNPMDYSLPSSSVLGMIQARILEGVAVPSSRVSSPPRDQTLSSDVSCIGRRILDH